VTAPQRRICLFLTSPFDLEIVVLGDPERLAIFMVELRRVLETWHGFESVNPLTMGSQVIGFTARRSTLATHDDPIAEVLLMMRRWPIDWPALLNVTHGVCGTW
jgi:hypothetical protein